MPRTTKTTKRPRTTTDVAKDVREDQKRALAKAIRREKDIQKFIARLNVEMQRSNDKIQQLAIVLGSFSRAVQAERESARALDS